MFATMFVGVLNVTTGCLIYINAGHEPPIILTAAGEIVMLRPTGPAVGLLPKMNFISRQVQLNPDDILLAFTDGVTEATSPAEEILGKERLQAILKKRYSSAVDVIDHVKRVTFEHLDSAPQNDDITLLCVRRKTAN
jgi:sigma-B regulation protein RsbU (phosphoserine phosphatase)